MNSNRRHILNELLKFKRKQFRLGFFKDKQDLLNLIKFETSFLDDNATLSERLFCIRENITKRKICPVCKIMPLNFSVSKQAYYETGCCPSCSKKNKLVQEKTQKTNLKKYGFKSHNSSPKIKQKKIDNFIKKHGVANPSYLTSVKEKRRQTQLKHFGVNCSLKLKSNRDKRHVLQLIDSYENHILTNMYDSPMFSLEEYLQRKNEHEMLKFKCKVCGNVFETWHHDGFHSRCPICYPKSISISEKELQDFISQFVSTQTNTKEIIPPFELDVYVPEKKLAFEFDGLYWHSLEAGKTKEYHLHKTQECEKQGIQLIHIFENEWLKKKEIVKGFIRNLLGSYDNVIMLENCEVKEVDEKTSKFFLKTNYILDEVDTTINLGLFYHDELVSLMSFKKLKIRNENSWKLVCFCNKLGFNVPEVKTYLLKCFENNYKPTILISYVDRRYFSGELQKNLGFKLKQALEPKNLVFQ